MPKLPIDLSQSNKMCEPCSPMMDSEREHYPSLHLEWDSDYNLPESGEMTVKFRKVSETNSKHGGKSRQSVTLDILSIEDVTKKAVKNDDEDEDYEEKESSGDRLDKMAKEASDEEGDD